MGADIAVAEKPLKLREAERADAKVRIHKTDLPWLPGGFHEAHLIKMRTGNQEFLFGSAIIGRALTDAANQLDAHRSEICNNLLYTHLPSFAAGYNPKVATLAHAITNKPIFYIWNKGGQRVYFMRFGNLDRMPIIVKIAACDKANQTDVLSVLTDQSRKQIKKQSKL